MIRRPPRSTLSSSSAASDVYKRQHLRIDSWHLEDKLEAGLTSSVQVEAVPAAVNDSDFSPYKTGLAPNHVAMVRWSTDDKFFGFSGLTAAVAQLNGVHCPEFLQSQSDQPAHQMAVTMQNLKALLTMHQLHSSSVVYCRLYIADMSHFGLVNAEYCKCFGVNPPSRLCVAMPLPDGILVELECFGVRGGSTPVQTLHVQSISRWAPTCIGPYSQATGLHHDQDRVLHMAGQIGQYPPTMSLIGPSLRQQAEQCIANIDAITRVELPSDNQIQVSQSGSVLFLSTTVFVVPRSQGQSLETVGQVVQQLLGPRAVGSVLTILVPALPRDSMCEVAVCAAKNVQVHSATQNSECCFSSTEAFSRACGDGVQDFESTLEAAFESLEGCEGEFSRDQVASLRVYVAPTDQAHKHQWSQLSNQQQQICTLGLVWANRTVELVVELHAIKF
eukprot:TRINITY_DN24425_c0_g2_i2.p1 TRINITY_DN24425_c0_g2~~TRINITY_DN24425_c0_g2_i2.p1  ORF type:complete len:445 (-),score=54.20 TRINITY_DN24425_c0_g2_i2:194-1528(-)